MSTEFAVIQTGGKQHLVKKGREMRIEKLSGEYKEGDAITFDKVLLFDDGKAIKVGTPYLPGGSVTATILEIGRAKKIEVVKYKAKSRYFKLRGHRQPYFKVRIEKIA